MAASRALTVNYDRVAISETPFKQPADRVSLSNSHFTLRLIKTKKVMKDCGAYEAQV